MEDFPKPNIQDDIVVYTIEDSITINLHESSPIHENDSQFQEEMQSLKEEIQEKRRQMRVLVGNGEVGPYNGTALELSQKISKLSDNLNEKSFELELKTTDNRIFPERLQPKIAENMELQTTITALREQLSRKSENSTRQNDMENHIENNAKSHVLSLLDSKNQMLI